MDNPVTVTVNTSDIASALQAGNKALGALIGVVNGLFPRAFGSFALTAASTKVVTDANVTSASVIMLMPTNASAGTLMGSAKSLYVTPASGSFTVTTASGVAAAGGEAFSYVAFTPI